MQYILVTSACIRSNKKNIRGKWHNDFRIICLAETKFVWPKECRVNEWKVQICAFAAKKDHFISAPEFKAVSLQPSKDIEVVCVDIQSDHCRSHLKSTATLAYKVLGNKAVLHALTKTLMPNSYYLWPGSTEYQLLIFESIHKRGVRNFDNPNVMYCLEPPSLRKNFGSLFFWTVFSLGKYSKELLEIMQSFIFYIVSRPEQFIFSVWSHLPVRFKSYLCHITFWVWKYLPSAMLHMPSQVYETSQSYTVFKREHITYNLSPILICRN